MGNTANRSHLHDLKRIRRYMMRGHAALGQSVPADQEQRVEEVVNLA